jgi:multiple sugar transport system substrate-binding protein
MNHQSTDNEHIRKVFTRRAFLGRAAKAALQLTLTGQLLLSKKALAGAYAGQSLNLVLIQPHKISGEVLSKSFAEQTGAKLNVTIVPYDVIEAQATLDVQSGANQFDVVEYWYASIGSLVENNVLQDVTDPITKDEATIKTSDYIRSIYDPYTLYKGKRWGLPYDGDTHVLFYNTTLLDKHKVNAPTTWDEYLVAAKTITEAEKQNGVYGAIVMGAAIPVIIGSTFANRLAGFGGEFLKADGTPNLESDAAFKAAKALLDVAPYALPTPVETAFEQAVPSFLDGKGAFVECWTDLGVYAQDAQKSKISDQWDVVQLPVEKKGDQPRASLNAGFGLGLSTATKKKELAWEFVKWATGYQTALELLTTSNSGIDPTRITTLNAAEYKRFAPKVQRAANAALHGAVAWPTIPESPKMMRSLSEKLNRMLADRQSPELAIRQINSDWVQILQG